MFLGANIYCIYNSCAGEQIKPGSSDNEIKGPQMANIHESVQTICRQYGNGRVYLMDILRETQARWGCISPEAIDAIATALNMPRVEIEGAVTFYAFLATRPQGRIVIRLCDDIIDRCAGGEEVAEAFRNILGVREGQTTADGRFTLAATPCIGMCDQAPAALINDVVVTELTADKARRLVQKLQADSNPAKLVERYGDGNNAHPLVRAMVKNNLRRAGEVIFGDYKPHAGLQKALSLSPQEVIRLIKNARLRGRGGAGFPTGMKWEFARQAADETRFIVCNADEGEPGTFKDRVLLTERPDMLFEGMTIAGYAVGAQTGILYLRAEYVYLRSFLEHALARRRQEGVLGAGICGKKDFSFDIRIVIGAGAYVCGEETSLLSSAEGGRGDPKNRPPFPAQKGYLGHPTVVNNVETFCCAARIIDQGAGWFAAIGSAGSPGTKLLSISGDCKSPGVYEVPFGIKLREFLSMAGAEDAAFVIVGGPSGHIVGRDAFDQAICYDHLATGGSVMAFGAERDLLEIVAYYMRFFVEESCGYCTPCRVGNVLLCQLIEKVRAGKGEADDLALMEEIGRTVKATSRCGFGQTSPNPVLSTLRNFRSLYTAKIAAGRDGLRRGFNLQEAVREAALIAGRK